jgi:6-phospho-beta-glucosidase
VRRRKLAVLGGSSPFAAALLDELGAVEAMDLTLHGRDREALGLLATYGTHRLGPSGWRVTWTADLAEALGGADVVLHQIRYGGLDGRAADEELAARLGVPADETLGPSGLRAALRMAPGLADLARALATHCPGAVVLNLTNPLSCSTALLTRWSPCAAFGLCELPEATAAEACALLEVPVGEVDWEYAGLNHRGFVLRLLHRGRDLLPDLPGRLGGGDLGGITGPEIARLGALPLKYFSLFTRSPGGRVSRAGVLMHTRQAILDELRADPTATPPSLATRHQPWYRDAVVPFLGALTGGTGAEVVVSVTDADGIAREHRADASATGVVPRPRPPVPDAVAAWLERFETHERLVLDAATEPTPASIGAALAADPLLPPAAVGAATRALLVELPA